MHCSNCWCPRPTACCPDDAPALVCRGHLGGLVGGAAAAMVLGPNYHIEWLPRRVEKRIGTPRAKWVGGRLAELHTRAQVFNARLVDWPALPLFRAPPKLIYWEGPAQPRN